MKKLKLLKRALAGSRNFQFGEFVTLVEASGSAYPGPGAVITSSSTRDPELLNLQNVNGEAKPYQIRQFLRLVERYNLSLREDS